MTKVHNKKELRAGIDFAAEYATKIIVERGVNGREIEVAVLGNDEPKASIPGEIVPHREFYDYAAKYLEDGTKLLIPAPLNRAQVKKFQELAVRAFRVLDCAGMARVDFFLEKRPAGLSQRDQYHSRFHIDQHVSKNVGSQRNSLSRSDHQTN